jgi:hypothetical protein
MIRGLSGYTTRAPQHQTPLPEARRCAGLRGFIALFVLMLAPSGAFAGCNVYGNCYSSYGNGYSGYNARTGSEWNSRTYGGTTYGTDSNGNSWSYRHNSGTYYNSGTGEYRSRGLRY